jgi:hypothetical protein
MNRKTWKLIQYWRDKYNSTPNGWAVAYMVGEDYVSELSKINKKRNVKRNKKIKNRATDLQDV